MKSMQPRSVAIFFMTYFHRAGGGAMYRDGNCELRQKTHKNSTQLSYIKEFPITSD